jgi:hypothetical protein
MRQQSIIVGRVIVDQCPTRGFDDAHAPRRWRHFGRVSAPVISGSFSSCTASSAL